MYVSQQLLRTHYDDVQRQAAAHQRASQARAARRPAAARPGRAPLNLRAWRPGRAVSQV